MKQAILFSLAIFFAQWLQAQSAISFDITYSAQGNCADAATKTAPAMDLYLYPLDKENGITPLYAKDGKHANVKAGRYLVTRYPLDHPDDLQFYRDWYSGKNDIANPDTDRRTVNKKVIYVGKDLKQQTFAYHYHNYCGFQIDPSTAPVSADNGKKPK